MKTLPRILLIVSIILALLIAGMFYYIQVNSSPDTARAPVDTSQPKAQKTVNPKADFGVSLYPIDKLETGKVILYGELISLEGDNLTIDYSDDIETFKLTPQTAVILLSEGMTESKTIDYLRNLTFPQKGRVSFDGKTKEAVSVGVLN